MMLHNGASATTREDLVVRILEVLPRLVRALQRAASAAGGEPLTLPQLRLLMAIGTDCHRTADLATRLELAPATVSASVDGLVRRWLVLRAEHPSHAAGDRRVVPLSLTDAGMAAVAAAQGRQQSALLNLLDGVSEAELKVLEAACATWEHQLGKTTREGDETR